MCVQKGFSCFGYLGGRGLPANVVGSGAVMACLPTFFEQLQPLLRQDSHLHKLKQLCNSRACCNCTSVTLYLPSHFSLLPKNSTVGPAHVQQCPYEIVGLQQRQGNAGGPLAPLLASPTMKPIQGNLVLAMAETRRITGQPNRHAGSCRVNPGTR
jgi:hypothetical protein